MEFNDRIRYELSVIGTYIAEHGQESGSVSWQMAQQASNVISAYVEYALGVLGNRDLMIGLLREAIKLGRLSVDMGICSGTSLDDNWIENEAIRIVDESFKKPDV